MASGDILSAIASQKTLEEVKERLGEIGSSGKDISEILEELKKYYGVHIRFDAAKINNPVLTVKFRLSDGIEYALRVLQKDVKFKYVRNDEENTFVIK